MLVYRAPATGSYLVALLNVPTKNLPADRSYTLDIQPIARDTAAPSPSSVVPATPSVAPASVNSAATSTAVGPSSTSSAIIGGLPIVGPGITGFLDTAGRLNLVGPTGYGFALTGNWTAIVTPAGGGTTGLTFIATAGVNIVSPLGQLPLPLPRGGALILTAQPNGAGGAFGTISQARMLTGLAWLDALTTNFFQPVFGMNATFPVGSTSLQIQTAQGLQLGVALGSTINSSVDPNAPLNPNIPYLYYVVSGGLGGKFDNVSVGFAQTLESVIVDPADPMVYYGLILPALPVFASAGFGLSANGLIPFTPLQKPSQFSGSLSGNVYAQLELNLPIPELPVLAVNVNATTVIDLNANHDGAWLNYLESNPGTFIAALVTGGLPGVVATNPALAADVALGVNGSVGLTVNTVNNFLTITVSPAQGTLIDTGTTSPNVYFRGLATNGLASGNFLQNFTSFLSPNQTFILDGAYLSATATLSASFMAQYSTSGSPRTRQPRSPGRTCSLQGRRSPRRATGRFPSWEGLSSLTPARSIARASSR